MIVDSPSIHIQFKIDQKRIKNIYITQIGILIWNINEIERNFFRLIV